MLLSCRSSLQSVWSQPASQVRAEIRTFADLVATCHNEAVVRQENWSFISPSASCERKVQRTIPAFATHRLFSLILHVDLERTRTREEALLDLSTTNIRLGEAELGKGDVHSLPTSGP